VRNSKGFTLLELVIVIFIISLAAAIILPRLPASNNSDLKSSAVSTATMLRYLGERSVTSNIKYRLHINVSDSTIKVTQVSNTGEESTPDDPFFSKKFISGDTQIADIETPRLGKITEGETIFDFGPAGLTEFLTIHFKTPDGKTFYTVAAFPNTGKVKILEGNQELSL